MAAGHGEILSSPGIHELFALINVSVVIALVYLFGRQGISDSFRGRSQKLREELVNAREELKKLRSDIELSRSQLANIQREKNELVSKVEEEGRQLSRRLVDEAKFNAQRILEDSSRAVQAEYAEMQDKLKAELLDSIVAKVQEEFLTENSRQKLHEKLLDGFVSQSGSLSRELKAEGLS